MGRNKEFKIGAIKNLMQRNYNVPTDLIDIETLVDVHLTMPENWNKIKPKVLMLCNKPNKILYE